MSTFPTDLKYTHDHEWLRSSGRNEYGDAPGTVYAGGNPLFDERSPRLKDRYEYILSRHPELRDSSDAKK